MNSIISNRYQHHYQRSSLHDFSKSNKHELSIAPGSRIVSEKLNERGEIIDKLLKETMFNRGTNPGSNVGGMGDKTNSGNNPNFQRHPASNNALRNFASGTGLFMGSSQTGHQQNPSSLAAQTQALAQQQQQQRLLQMTKNELEVQQMASNIQESLLIKRRLESIKHLQQQEANKMRAELQMNVPGGIGRRNSSGISTSAHRMLSGGTKPIPSTSNSSVVPTKQREDEMTKPDLSTLAETAVAVASANTATNAHSRGSSSILGMGGVMKMNANNNTGSNQIAALLGRQPSSVSSLKGLTSMESSQSIPASITGSISNNAMTDALRRDINATRDKMHLENNYKRSLDEMTKSNTTTAPSPSSWLLKSAALGNSPPLSMEQLRARHEQLQRRNSLPAPASAISELASLRSLKRQRLIDQKASEIGRLELHEAMKQMRQLDAKMNMRMTSNSSLLAEMASKIAHQERRASIASSVASLGAASVGTTATAPNLTTGSALSSPVNRRSLVIPDNNLDERSKVLNKLSKMGGGFPMPKFKKELPNAPSLGFSTAPGSMNNNIPAEITPELGKDVVDITGRESSSLSLQQQLKNDQQSRYLERIGGFPMPPLYRHNDENQVSNNETTVMMRGQAVRTNNAISSHIRNNKKCCSTNVSRPPSLESYKRVWRDIRVVAGDDPQVDERLRKEVFARKLQRGEIFVGKNSSSNVLQRRLSELSHGSVMGNSSNSGRAKGGTQAEESIVI